MNKKPDIFNDDDAYKEYLLLKEEEEKRKKERIDKVLDDYCYKQLNLPASEYRSHQTDLIYKPREYPVNIVHPQRDDYNAQYIGFNQNSNTSRKRAHMQQQPQQYYYPPANPYAGNVQQQVGQYPQVSPFQQNANSYYNELFSSLAQSMYQQQHQQLMPSLSIAQGNLGYNQEIMGSQGQNLYPQYPQQQQWTDKQGFIRKCDSIQNRIDYMLRNTSSLYQQQY